MMPFELLVRIHQIALVIAACWLDPEITLPVSPHPEKSA